MISTIEYQDMNKNFEDIVFKDKLKKIINANTFDIICPRCKGININKNGKTKIKRQRYICKDCSKSFSEMTGSPLWYSKKVIDIWIKYFACIKERFTLKEIASKLQINLTTSFQWRHKILSVLGSKFIDNNLTDTIEIDELKLKENHKGSNLSRINNSTKNESRFYQNLSLAYNNFENSISIISCIDSNNAFIFKALAKGILKKEHLDKILAPLINKVKLMITPRNNQYKLFAKANNLNITMNSIINSNIGSFEIKKSKVQAINFKVFLEKFNGVASKYISFYINWYRLGLERRDTTIEILQLFLSGSRQIRVYEFKHIQFDGNIKKYSNYPKEVF